MQAAFNGESNASARYAAFSKKASEEGYKEIALTALAGNTVNSLPKTYFVCPTCGNTYENAAPKRCSISMTSGEKFIKVDTL